VRVAEALSDSMVVLNVGHGPQLFVAGATRKSALCKHCSNQLGRNAVAFRTLNPNVQNRADRYCRRCVANAKPEPVARSADK
jgi:hypothetical protein